MGQQWLWTIERHGGLAEFVLCDTDHCHRRVRGTGGPKVTTGSGLGSPKWNPNETPARAGAVNSVVIPMTANPNRTCFFIVARFDDGFRPPFRIRALIVDRGPSGASMNV